MASTYISNRLLHLIFLIISIISHQLVHTLPQPPPPECPFITTVAKLPINCSTQGTKYRLVACENLDTLSTAICNHEKLKVKKFEIDDLKVEEQWDCPSEEILRKYVEKKIVADIFANPQFCGFYCGETEQEKQLCKVLFVAAKFVSEVGKDEAQKPVIVASNLQFPPDNGNAKTKSGVQENSNVPPTKGNSDSQAADTHLGTVSKPEKPSDPTQPPQNTPDKDSVPNPPQNTPDKASVPNPPPTTALKNQPVAPDNTQPPKPTKKAKPLSPAETTKEKSETTVDSKPKTETTEDNKGDADVKKPDVKQVNPPKKSPDVPKPADDKSKEFLLKEDKPKSEYKKTEKPDAVVENKDEEMKPQEKPADKPKDDKDMKEKEQDGVEFDDDEGDGNIAPVGQMPPNFEETGDKSSTVDDDQDMVQGITSDLTSARDKNDQRFSKPIQNIIGQAAYPDNPDSHFFVYFLTIVVLCVILYLAFHNKQKIIALIVEGRHERRRRPHNVSYKKLDSNLDEVLSGKGSSVTTPAHIIY